MSEEKASPGIPPGSWPVPLGLPLYVSVEQAAKLAGVGRSKTLIRTSAIPEYMRRRETA